MASPSDAAPTMIRGRAFPPGRSRPESAELRLDARTVELLATDGRRLAAGSRAELRFDAPIGRAPRRATLPDGTLFETDDREAVARLDGRSAGALRHRLERPHPRLALLALGCLLAGWLVWRFGLDLMVAAAVALTPSPLVAAMDAGTLRSLDLALARPSAAAPAERREAQAVFDRLLAALGPEVRADRRFRLEFRAVPGVGPNAFALPGGTVVLTDTFLGEFTSEDVRAGVLAHEIGHVVESHGLRQIYRSLGIFALISLMAGDGGPALEDVLLEGNLLLSLRYSRASERRADDFGVELATAAGYDPAGLIGFFEWVEAQAADLPGWASTHPGTGERIELLRRRLDAP